jgi:hypothetical protein
MSRRRQRAFGARMRLQQQAQHRARQGGAGQDEQGVVGIHDPDSIAAPEGAAM